MAFLMLDCKSAGFFVQIFMVSNSLSDVMCVMEEEKGGKMR